MDLANDACLLSLCSALVIAFVKLVMRVMLGCLLVLVCYCLFGTMLGCCLGFVLRLVVVTWCYCL